eukprot:2145880-Alexandrium_andersonii.AAC.1
MSASLVGSEMCIRDSVVFALPLPRLAPRCLGRPRPLADRAQPHLPRVAGHRCFLHRCAPPAAAPSPLVTLRVHRAK